MKEGLSVEKGNYPVLYFEKNLIFTQGRRDLQNIDGKEAWACYKLVGFNYDFLNVEEKIRTLMEVERGFQQVYSEAQLLMLPIKSNISDNINFLKSICTSEGNLRKEALYMLSEEQELIGEEEEEIDYDVYFIVKLKKPRTVKDFKDFIFSVIREPVRVINELAGTDITEIFENELKSFLMLERSLFSQINKYIKIYRLDGFDIERLVKEPFWRGNEQAMPMRSKEDFYDNLTKTFTNTKKWACNSRIVKTPDGRTVIRPNKREIYTLTDGEVLNKPRSIEVTQVVGNKEITTLQKFLAISALPDMYFPTNREWLYNIKRLNFPVYISGRFRKEDYKKVSQDINKSKKDVNDQMEHIKSADKEIDIEYLEQDRDIAMAEYTVKSEKKPFLYTTVVVGVISDNVNELEDRIKDVRDYFDELEIETQIPTGEQLMLFEDFFLGNEQKVTSYMLRIPPDTLAGSMIGATTQIGDNLGIHIARTGTGKPVRIYPERASRENFSPSMSFTGGLGRGKSVAANLIAIKSVLLGAKVLICDPKGDRRYWAKIYPELAPYTNMVQLEATEKNKGKLDIFQIYLNMEKRDRKKAIKEAAEHAITILCSLLGYAGNSAEREYIAYATMIVSKQENPRMGNIIKALRAMLESSKKTEEQTILDRIIRAIQTRIDATAYAHLIFSDDNDVQEVLDISKSLNIIETKNLILPDEGKLEENFTFSEQVGMAILITISAIGMKFATQSTKVLTIYVQDEASVFKRSSIGKNMFNRLVKMGRSENAPIYIIGQNISDIGDENVQANIGTRFCFGTDNKNEAKEILTYLGLNENSEELIKMMTNPSIFGTGVALMRDIEGRIAVVHIDSVSPRFIKLFDSRPQNQLEE